MPDIAPLEQLEAKRFETPAILKKLASSSRALAELKGIAASIPNQGILINTLGLQEAKDRAGSSLKCDTAHPVRCCPNATSLLAPHRI